MYFEFNGVTHLQTEAGFKRLVPSTTKFFIKKGLRQGDALSITLKGWETVPQKEVPACRQAWEEARKRLDKSLSEAAITYEV